MKLFNIEHLPAFIDVKKKEKSEKTLKKLGTHFSSFILLRKIENSDSQFLTSHKKGSTMFILKKYHLSVRIALLTSQTVGCLV